MLDFICNNKNIMFLTLLTALVFHRMSIAVGNVFLGLTVLFFILYIYKNGLYIKDEYKVYYKVLGVTIISALPMIILTGAPLYELMKVSEMWLYRAIPFFILSLFAYSSKLIKKGIMIFLISISLDSIVAMGQVVFGISDRGWGFGGNILILGSIVTFLIPIMLLVIFDDKFTKNEKVFCFIVLIFCIIGSLAGKCRSSWVTLAFTVPLVTIPYMLKSQKVVVAMLISLCMIIGFLLSNPSYMNRVNSITNIRTDQSNYQRIAVWNAGADMFKDYWVTGTGNKEYRTIYENQYRPEADKQGLVHMHNNIVQFAVTGGIAYLLGYLFFNIFIIYRNLHEWIKNRDVYSFMVSILFISYFIYGLFDYTMGYSTGVKNLFFVLGVILVLKNSRNVI